eukprot:COSAG01_NODE_27260_length_690_cov_1.035533_1_plen_144_part_01
MQTQHAIDRSIDQSASQAHTVAEFRHIAESRASIRVRSGRRGSMQSRICKQERQSQVNPPCIQALLQHQKEWSIAWGGAISRDSHTVQKTHTYSTSTYYEAKNSSQFFWLAEWFVRSANMNASICVWPHGMAKCGASLHKPHTN